MKKTSTKTGAFVAVCHTCGAQYDTIHEDLVCDNDSCGGELFRLEQR